MIRILMTIGLLLLSLPAAAETMVLAPHYNAIGKNPDGSKYSGTVDIVVISDTTFSIVWHIGGSIYKGFGMRRNESLAATYTIGGEPGLVIYESDRKGGFSGLWSVRGEDGSGSEVLIPAK